MYRQLRTRRNPGALRGALQTSCEEVDMRNELNRVNRRFSWYLAGLAVAGILFASVTGSADVVPPPPDECPIGSDGDTCHGGPYCRLSVCTDDSNCREGTCQELEICVGSFLCPGRMGPGMTMQTSEGACTGGAECDSGTCETVRVCAPTPEPEPEDDDNDNDTDGESGSTAPATQGAGCAIASSRTAGALFFGLAFFAAVMLRARRRPRS